VEPAEKSVDCFAAQNYPNPFHDATDIRYYISEEGILTLEIYDSTGRMVIRRIQKATPGWQTFTWDGRSSSGKPVSSGIYFYRLNMAGKSMTRKMALMR
jgi:flagellar hook assembly protein FlgD